MYDNIAQNIARIKVSGDRGRFGVNLSQRTYQLCLNALNNNPTDAQILELRKLLFLLAKQCLRTVDYWDNIWEPRRKVKERGRPDIELLHNIAKTLNVSIQELQSRF